MRRARGAHEPPVPPAWPPISANERAAHRPIDAPYARRPSLPASALPWLAPAYPSLSQPVPACSGLSCPRTVSTHTLCRSTRTPPTTTAFSSAYLPSSAAPPRPAAHVELRKERRCPMPARKHPSVGCIVLCCAVRSCAGLCGAVPYCARSSCRVALAGWLAGCCCCCCRWLLATGCLCTGSFTTPPTTTRASRSQPAGSRPEMTPRNPALAAVPSRYAGRASRWERRRDKRRRPGARLQSSGRRSAAQGTLHTAYITVKQRLKHGRRDSGERLFCGPETRQPPPQLAGLLGVISSGHGLGTCILRKRGRGRGRGCGGGVAVVVGVGNCGRGCACACAVCIPTA